MDTPGHLAEGVMLNTASCAMATPGRYARCSMHGRVSCHYGNAADIELGAACLVDMKLV
jgi:hypothetical protein